MRQREISDLLRRKRSPYQGVKTPKALDGRVLFLRTAPNRAIGFVTMGNGSPYLGKALIPGNPPGLVDTEISAEELATGAVRLFPPRRWTIEAIMNAMPDEPWKDLLAAVEGVADV